MFFCCFFILIFQKSGSRLFLQCVHVLDTLWQVSFYSWRKTSSFILLFSASNLRSVVVSFQQFFCPQIFCFCCLFVDYFNFSSCLTQFVYDIATGAMQILFLSFLQWPVNVLNDSRVLVFFFLIAALASRPAIIALLLFYFVVLIFFLFTLVHSLFNILREIFWTSLG